MHRCMHNHVIALSESARKNFVLLVAKSKQFGNFPFEAFSSLHESQYLDASLMQSTI